MPLGHLGIPHVAGLGIGLSYITLNLTMLELADAGQEGRASSSMQLAGVLGSALPARPPPLSHASTGCIVVQGVACS